MRKLILALVLMTISNTALAEWREFNDDENFTTYIDVQSIRKNEGTARMWVLVNFKVPKLVGKEQVGSLRLLNEFDCVDERIRTLDTHFFKRKMADGLTPNLEKKVVGEWAYLAPQTGGYVMMEIACREL